MIYELVRRILLYGHRCVLVFDRRFEVVRFSGIVAVPRGNCPGEEGSLYFSKFVFGRVIH